MRLRDALRTTAAVREFSDEPVSDEVVYAILDTARFSPSGGNRQGWRVVLVRDSQLRRALRDLYRPAWREYVTLSKAGLVVWAPITDRDRERQAIAEAAIGTGPTEAPSFHVIQGYWRRDRASWRLDHYRSSLCGRRRGRIAPDGFRRR